jgi:hypothetical protein
MHPCQGWGEGMMLLLLLLLLLLLIHPTSGGQTKTGVLQKMK